MSFLAVLHRYRELIWNLVMRDLKSRYRGSILGLLWTVLTPLFMAFIYIFFLRLLIGRGVVIRHEEILIGVFAWQFTVQCVQSGMGSITSNSNLVKKIYFPRFIIPLSITISALINFLLMLSVQLVLVTILLVMSGSHLSGWTVLLPIIIGYHLLFNLSIALLTAASNVYFRDTQHFVGLFLSAWFFVSPLMYSLTLLEAMAGARAWVYDLYMLNPLALIITAYRTLQIPDSSFPWSTAAVIGWVWPLILAVYAVFAFQRAQRNFADML